jgi:hypothetical protein
MPEINNSLAAQIQVPQIDIGKRMMDGLSFGAHEIDNLQGILLNARVRAGSFR